MDTERIEKLRETVKGLCLESKYYSPSVFTHSCNCEGYAVRLCDRFGGEMGGDMFITRSGALTHDLGAILYGRDGENGEGHHITGARAVAPVLSGTGYTFQEIVEIQYAILVHRGSTDVTRKTPEARYVATADAWDHFTNIDELWRVGQQDLGMNTRQTHAWLTKKLRNDWRKVMPEAEEIIRPDFERAKAALISLYF